jgi:hypothetical protein
MRNIAILACIASANALFAAAPPTDPQARSMQRKLDMIQSGKAPRGAVFVFTLPELNAWARYRVPLEVPQGVREPKVELGDDAATASALVDLLKVREGQGASTNWLIAKLIEGEKPIRAAAQIQSSNGYCTVHLERVDIGGVVVGGSTLDILIRTFFLPLYPDAKIDQPFELADRVDRIRVSPAEVRVYMK